MSAMAAHSQTAGDATRKDGPYRYLVLPGNESALMREAMERRPWWRPAEEGGAWNFWWGGNGQKFEWASFGSGSNEPRMVNRIENHKEVCSKSGLAENLAILAQQPDAPAWIPETYVLSQGDPKGAAAFKRAYERHARAGTGTTWIVKPTSCNRGNGIEIFNAAAAVLAHVGSRRPGSRSIVQKYIDAPLLVGGRKFDLRAYVLVTPGREVFLHREAYVRTCATPYSLSDVSNKASHLTNDAVQKKTEEYGQHEDHCKLTLDELQAAVGAAADVHGAVRVQMVDCVSRLFGLVLPKLDPKRRAHSFELFGLDFMIDAHGGVTLIEVNTSPALFRQGRYLSDLLPRVVEEVAQRCVDAVVPPPRVGDAPKRLDGFERVTLAACTSLGPSSAAAAAAGAVAVEPSAARAGRVGAGAAASAAPKPARCAAGAAAPAAAKPARTAGGASVQKGPLPTGRAVVAAT
uniref:Tubulin--tyrosine ligase-like protein 9 n=1 Tax=Chlamydomonas euryale TaxID=1486919 RepID=A0A7R9W2A9_9CHLO|mmetsp:Transcript_9608/g.29128  ORF Transcript_9608/g.29128 Transcript_9608/m.29128 type:complete len:461 (+) Transcript_9608:203-1585(+)